MNFIGLLFFRMEFAEVKNYFIKYARHQSIDPVYSFIRKQTNEKSMQVAQTWPLSIKWVRLQSNEVCIAAVRKKSDSLRYVRNQNKKICMNAVLECYHEYIYDYCEKSHWAAECKYGIHIGYIKSRRLRFLLINKMLNTFIYVLP